MGRKLSLCCQVNCLFNKSLTQIQLLAKNICNNILNDFASTILTYNNFYNDFPETLIWISSQTQTCQCCVCNSFHASSTAHCKKSINLKNRKVYSKQPNFQKWLQNFEVTASKFNINYPLSSMASKTAQSKILKIAF